MSSKHSTKASFEWVFCIRLSNTVKGYWEIRTSHRSTLWSQIRHPNVALIHRALRTPCTVPGGRNLLTLPTTTDSNYCPHRSFLSPPLSHRQQGLSPPLSLSLLFCCAFYGKLLLLPNKRAKLQGLSAVRSAGCFVIIIEMHYSHGHYKGQERWMLRPLRKLTFTYTLHQ